MKLIVAAVGKMRDRHMAAVCDEYVKRARRHLPIEEIEADDETALARRLPAGATLVALDPGGKPWTTAELTRFVEERMVHGARAVAFVIGGADGLSRELVARADLRLSLSPLTLPHRLARVILCEQIYRALSIIKGEPYSR